MKEKIRILLMIGVGFLFVAIGFYSLIERCY